MLARPILHFSFAVSFRLTGINFLDIFRAFRLHPVMPGALRRLCSLWFKRVESLSVFVYLCVRQIHLNLVLVAKTVSVVQAKHTTVNVIILPWHCSAVTAFGEGNCLVFVVIRTRPCFIDMFFYHIHYIHSPLPISKFVFVWVSVLQFVGQEISNDIDIMSTLTQRSLYQYY
jgi:hypothetical protein